MECVRSAAPSRELATYFETETEDVVVYHLLTEGRAWVRLETGDRLALEAGDIVMLPHGDTHIVENGPTTRTVDDSHHLIEILSQGLKLWRVGGGGEVTKFVCGYRLAIVAWVKSFSAACLPCLR